jgi:ABC-type glycerol-3-phosphate transport system permease component
VESDQHDADASGRYCDAEGDGRHQCVEYVMAGNLMLVAPALLLFVLAQRHIIMKAFVNSTK